MFFYRNPPKILYKSNEEESVLQQLSDYLDSHMSSPALILARLWTDQQAAMTYRDIREAIQNGEMLGSVVNDAQLQAQAMLDIACYESFR